MTPGISLANPSSICRLSIAQGSPRDSRSKVQKDKKGEQVKRNQHQQKSRRRTTQTERKQGRSSYSTSRGHQKCFSARCGRLKILLETSFKLP